MRYEGLLGEIYTNWLQQPGNCNVPDISADEALFEVHKQKEKLRDEAVGNDMMRFGRAYHRRDEQIIWLNRFIKVWTYFEDDR